MAEILINVGRIGPENDSVKQIDINPLIISGNKPVAVEALFVLGLERLSRPVSSEDPEKSPPAHTRTHLCMVVISACVAPPRAIGA